MANGGGTLSYRIELDAKEAEAALQGLQAAGNDLFRTLEKAAASLTAGGGFKAFATTITAAAGAVVGITTALFAMAKASSKTVDELGELAAQTGSTVTEMSALQSALVQLEANGETLQRAFQRMGNTIQEVWPEIQKSVREASTSMQKDMLSVENASLNLIEAQQKLTELKTGIKPSEAETEELAIKKQLLAVEQARIAEAEAIRKAQEAAANSVQRLAQYVDALAKGASTAGIEINKTTDNLIKGLVASVGPGVTALEGVSGGLGEISRKAPELRDVVLKLADVFANLTDQTLKMSIATKLFGRKDAQDMVEALSAGSAKVLELEQRMKALGLVITDADDALSKKFIAALNRLQSVAGIVGTQLGLLFQPAFTDAMNRIAEAVENNRGKILEWGAAIRDTLVPILETFTRVLLGVPEAGKDDWLVRYIANIRAFGEAVSGIVTNVVIPAFTALLAITGTMAKGINAVLGTELNAFDILIGAWVLKILGAFRLLAAVNLASLAGALNVVLVAVGMLGRAIVALPAAIALLGEAFTLLVTIATVAIRGILLALGPWGILLAAIGVAIVLIIAYWPELKAVAEATLNWINTKLEESAEFLKAWVLTPVANAWEWLKTAFNETVDYIMRKAEELMTWLRKVVGGGVPGDPAGGGDWAGPGGGAAHGGVIGGRGTGTSDSNLAWVSRGEHIMPARAVRQPGVLALLEALRRNGGNLRRVLDDMGRFALGGLVRGPIPAFAGGGMVGGGLHPVTIQFPGLPAIGGLRASSDVVDELRKAAALAQVRSGGRKPSRYS